MDLTLTREQTEHLSQQIASHVVSTATQLRHFFLVEDLVDSLKVTLSPPSWLPSGYLGAPWGWEDPGWGHSQPVDPADHAPLPQLALLFYILTFVGAVFNGLTLLILGERGNLPRGWGQGQEQGCWGLLGDRVPDGAASPLGKT